MVSAAASRATTEPIPTTLARLAQAALVERALRAQQTPLEGRIGAVVADVASGAHDSVAGDQHRNAVRAHDFAHRACRARVAYFQGYLAVGADFPARDGDDGIEDGALEGRVPVRLEV